MKIAVIGASGFTGKAVVNEALNSGHEVYAISRSGKFEEHAALTVIHHDVNDWQGLKEKVSDVDLIISNFNAGWDNPNLYQDFMNGSNAIIELAKALDVRIVIVGGAGSLYNQATNRQLFDDSPVDFQNMVRGAFDLYKNVLADTTFKWTFVSPAMNLTQEPATNNYNVGGDYVLYNDAGESNVSIYDLAHLLVHVAPSAHLLNKRITLANK